jgi:hypothetical protein
VSLFVVAWLFAAPAVATSILEVSLDEMLRGSDLVFEGQVIDAESRIDPRGGMIHTLVTFEILEIIKGPFSHNTITLSFLGGTVGEETVTVSAMRVPLVGEKGIYFVESLERRQVHPLYGWSQGHFLVVPDAQGIERVVTEDNRAVMAVVPALTVPRGQISKGVAQGLVVKDAASLAQALTAGEFKQGLIARLRAR